MNPLTIFEKHKAEERKLKERHIEEMKALEGKLKLQQTTCKHPSWTRYPNLFYALGETYPGEACNECGLQRHCD